MREHTSRLSLPLLVTLCFWVAGSGGIQHAGMGEIAEPLVFLLALAEEGDVQELENLHRIGTKPRRSDLRASPPRVAVFSDPREHRLPFARAPSA